MFLPGGSDLSGNSDKIVLTDQMELKVKAKGIYYPAKKESGGERPSAAYKLNNLSETLGRWIACNLRLKNMSTDPEGYQLLKDAFVGRS
jgi:hypothetical protein